MIIFFAITFSVLTSESLCETKTGDEGFIADSGVSRESWVDILNKLLSNRGNEVAVVMDYPDEHVAARVLQLAALEFGAYELMMQNPGKSVDEMLAILNAHTVKTGTGISPFTAAKVHIWYKDILNEEAEELRKSPEEVGAFLKKYIRIHETEKGTKMLVLHGKVWNRIIVPALVRHVPRVWPDLGLVSESPREIQRTLPPEAITYVHRSLNSREKYLEDRLYFDSNSELSKRMRTYAQSIINWMTIDYHVLKHLTSLQSPRCHLRDPVLVASEVNTRFFTVDNRPHNSVLYTPDRIRFWCRQILNRLDYDNSKIVSILYQNLTPDQQLLRLAFDGAAEYLIEPLSDGELRGVETVSPGAVYTAWDKWIKTHNGLRRKRPFEHSLPLGTSDVREPDTSLPVEAQIRVLQELSDTFMNFEELGTTETMMHIQHGLYVHWAHLRIYALRVKSLRSIPIELGNELVKIYEERIVTDAVTVLKNLVSDPSTPNYAAEDIVDLYEMIQAAIQANPESPYDVTTSSMTFPVHIWRDFIVKKRLELLQNNCE